MSRRRHRSQLIPLAPPPALGKLQEKTFCVRSLPIERWPAADRAAWEDACRPGFRLKHGGAAGHLSTAARNSFRQRYSYFLEFLQSTGRFDPEAEAGAHVIPANVDPYLERLRNGVSSVTVYNSIHMLRRAAQLIVPRRDYSWVIEIERDLALVMRPRSKLDRLVMTEVLVEAGVTLFIEAEAASHLSKIRQARRARNGLMVALLAQYPFRLKNFVALELDRTFMNIKGSWWFVVPGTETKSRRPDERQVSSLLKPFVDRYVEQFRPVLGRSDVLPAALWLSSADGRPMSYSAVEQIIAEATRLAIGVVIRPHLFRTAAATTAAVLGGTMPHLASALLQHTNRRVTEKHYNRASSLQAADVFARLIAGLRQCE